MMEYTRREPMKSTSARESTAFTMKTIKELLAEDQGASGEAVTQRSPLPKNQVQQPPHLRGGVPVVAESSSQTDDIPPKRSLMGRLMGG